MDFFHVTNNHTNRPWDSGPDHISFAAVMGILVWNTTGLMSKYQFRFHMFQVIKLACTFTTCANVLSMTAGGIPRQLSDETSRAGV